MRFRSRSAPDELEAGLTVAEITVASAILIAAMAGLFGVLVSFQTGASFQTARSRALNDLRITAGTFAKDARHSTGVTAFDPGTADPTDPSSITMETYVDGQVSPVRYRLVPDAADASKWNLEREAAGGSRLFVIKLTDNSVFLPFPDPPAGDPAALGRIRRIQLVLETKPQESRATVSLSTEVSLRNVPG